jgi:Zn-dependent protease with chaperone function
VALWVGTIALHAHALHRDRWTKAARQIEQVMSLAFIVLMAWWIGGDRIFVAPMTDQGAKGALALVILISLVSLAVSLYRERAQIRPLGATH